MKMRVRPVHGWMGPSVWAATVSKTRMLVVPTAMTRLPDAWASLRA